MDSLIAYVRQCTCLNTLGALAALYLALKVASAVARLVKLFVLPCKVNLAKLGEWAVVTGATDGIGKAYAEQLAAKGLNVVLISRTLSKLEDLAGAIRERYKVKTKVIAVDFTGGKEIYPGVASQLQDLDIAILVNNVGMGTGHAEYFTSVENREDVYAQMINCNLMSVTYMTNAVLPAMEKKKKGVIVNIGSISFIGMALLSVYAATKSYVNRLTIDLDVEYRKSGVLFQVVHPGLVSTKLSKVRPKLSAPTTTTFVRSALGTLGKATMTTGYWVHELHLMMSEVAPTLMKYVAVKSLHSTRARALKKKAQ